MSKELKSCPFCGSTNISMYKKGGFNGSFIWCECDMCGVTTKAVKAIECDDNELWERNAHNAELAKTRWNNRYSSNEIDVNKNMKEIKQELSNIKETCSRKEFEWLCRTINDINNKLEKRNT